MADQTYNDYDFASLIRKIDEEWGVYGEVSESGGPKVGASATWKQFKTDEGIAGQTALGRYLFEHRNQLFRPQKRTWRDYSCYNKNYWPGFCLFKQVVKADLGLEPSQVLLWLFAIFNEYDHQNPGDEKYWDSTGIFPTNWPINHLAQLLERSAESGAFDDTAVKLLEGLIKLEVFDDYVTPLKKFRMRLVTLQGEVSSDASGFVTYQHLPGDDFGEALQTELAELASADAERWHRTFTVAATANGARPSKSFQADAAELMKRIGKEPLRKLCQHVLSVALTAKHREVEKQYNWGKQTNTYTVHLVYTDENIVLLKGIVWICSQFQDAKTINLVADMVEQSMTGVPERGPAAQAVANAGLAYLETSPGSESIARLSRFSTSIKQKNVRKKTAEILERKAAKMGITPIQLAERSVPTYKLDAGRKTVAFDDYALDIHVEGPGKITSTWLKPDGSPQKTKPKIITDKAVLKAKFDKVKTELTAIKKIITAQRDRIDLLLAEDVSWSLDDLLTHYLTHPLVGTMAAKLIWVLDGTPALFVDGAWQDVTGAPVVPTDKSTATLWHPVEHSTDAVLAWRDHLDKLEIIQPWKQAYREVYHLTDAERNTNVYSNRMAAHMVKQHQASTLMGVRGWRYQLMGAYDDGLDTQFASKNFVTSPLRAQYLFHTNWDGESFNDAGIYTYVGTDQLRLVDAEDVPIELSTAPPRLLSEVLRDADLVVGVASVGNDPAWVDSGASPEAREYWTNYSFGDLDEFAKTRRGILERLIPRLKIRDVARVDGRYLHVQGSLNNYRIHLGSSNIMMDPGDRYLCIVPGAVTKPKSINLPFEGDSRLSVILSKALMLAEDEKITAADIVSQLER